MIDDSLMHPVIHASENKPSTEIAPEPAPVAAAIDGNDRYWGYAGAMISLLAIALFGWFWSNNGNLTPPTFTSVAQEPIEVLSTDTMINPRMRENYLKNFIAVKEHKKIKTATTACN